MSSTPLSPRGPREGSLGPPHSQPARVVSPGSETYSRGAARPSQAIIDGPAVTDEMHREYTILPMGCIDHTVAPDSQLVECLELTCECPGCKVIEVL